MKTTHNKITSALKAAAKSQGKTAGDVYNQFFREVFLHALMQTQSGWVIKGGTNICCRIPDARQTMDLDLYRRNTPTAAEQSAALLMRMMDGHTIGPYTFRIQDQERINKRGTIPSRRLRIRVLHGIQRELTSFGVDISGDLKVFGTVETLTVQRSVPVETEFLPESFQIHSYPIASQIADKLCAMYERHGDRPPGVPSTRYHDLYDLALIALQLTVEANDLREALDTQASIRRVTLPERVVIPDERWEHEYEAKARRYGSGYESLQSLDEAIRTVGLLVNPVLSRDSTISGCSWNPESMTWE